MSEWFNQSNKAFIQSWTMNGKKAMHRWVQWVNDSINQTKRSFNDEPMMKKESNVSMSSMSEWFNQSNKAFIQTWTNEQ